MNGLHAALLSIGVLAAFALIGGGGWLLATGRDRKHGLLMILAALVTFANVLIWALPTRP